VLGFVEKNPPILHRGLGEVGGYEWCGHWGRVVLWMAVFAGMIDEGAWGGAGEGNVVGSPPPIKTGGFDGVWAGDGQRVGKAVCVIMLGTYNGGGPGWSLVALTHDR